MPQVIVVGSPTSHGGVVLSGSSQASIEGKGIARVGDPCSCPIAGHDHCVIVEGDPDDTLDGIPVAYEGCQTSCGAVLLGGAAVSGKG